MSISWLKLEDNTSIFIFVQIVQFLTLGVDCLNFYYSVFYYEMFLWNDYTVAFASLMASF